MNLKNSLVKILEYFKTLNKPPGEGYSSMDLRNGYYWSGTITNPNTMDSITEVFKEMGLIMEKEGRFFIHEELTSKFLSHPKK